MDIEMATGIRHKIGTIWWLTFRGQNSRMTVRFLTWITRWCGLENMIGFLSNKNPILF